MTLHPKSRPDRHRYREPGHATHHKVWCEQKWNANPGAVALLLVALGYPY